jgi:hypothetical protein
MTYSAVYYYFEKKNPREPLYFSGYEYQKWNEDSKKKEISWNLKLKIPEL